jgi:nucleoside-diphosphate-sugar epimerase
MIGVTGANGLLGSFIVRKLIDEKTNFVAFKRTGSDTSMLEDVKDKIEWRNLDLNDAVSMDDSLQGVTGIIHAAAMVSFNPRHASAISRINTEGTRNIVNACLANGVRRFIYISSVGALGRTKGQTQIDEKNKWVENSLQTAYATSKYLAELEVFRGQEEGLSAVIVNPSVILAPADWSRSSAKLFKYVWDERRFYIDGSLNYVDVRDVAAATWLLFSSGIENERFIVSAGAVSFKEFFDAVATRFAKKGPMIKLSKNFLNIVAGLEAMRARIRRSEPLITQETARLAGTSFYFENKKIKKTLQFEFRTLDNTLDWCCRYYMEKFGFKKG